MCDGFTISFSIYTSPSPKHGHSFRFGRRKSLLQLRFRPRLTYSATSASGGSFYKHRISDLRSCSFRVAEVQNTPVRSRNYRNSASFHQLACGRLISHTVDNLIVRTYKYKSARFAQTGKNHCFPIENQNRGEWHHTRYSRQRIEYSAY